MCGCIPFRGLCTAGSRHFRYNRTREKQSGFDRFDRAAVHGFVAEGLFLRSFRLFVDERMSAVVIPLVIRGRGFPTEIAVDALVIDIVFSFYVFRILICSISHVLSLKAKGNVGRNIPGAMIFVRFSWFCAAVKPAKSEESVTRATLP